MKFFTLGMLIAVFSVSVAHGAGGSDFAQEHDNFIQDRNEATPQQMAGIWYSLKAVKSEEGRVSVLRYVAQKYWLRTVQARALVEMIVSEDDRADLLVAIYPRLTNPDRFETLLTLLPDANLRQVTRNRVGLQVTASL